MKEGKPAYVTALGQSDAPGGWRGAKAHGGILINVESNEVILKNLSMPHSPRIFNNKLYVLLSGTGELAEVDTQKGTYNVVTRMPGFVRGMTRHGDYLFIGMSKLRTKSTAFNDLPISKKSLFSGVMIVHLPTGSIVGNIKYENSVDEIFDVQVLPSMKRPGIINTSKNTHHMTIVTPEESFWAVPQETAKA
jgi:uncharacterized protein (TIGR03032 family)